MDFKLNKKSNIRAGIVFANMFNLQAKITDIINEDYFAFDLTQNGSKVGTITSKEEKVKIEAKTADFELKASYKMPKSYKSSSLTFHTTKIKYQLTELKNYGLTLKGEVDVSGTTDLYNGNKCSCSVITEISHPHPSFGTIQLNLSSDISDLYFSHITPNIIETASMNYSYQKIEHEIFGDLEENGHWHIKKYNLARINNSDVKLLIVSQLQNDKKSIYHYNEEKPINKNFDTIDNSTILSEEMQRNDPELYKKLNQLKSYLKINDFSLLDSLVNATSGKKLDTQILGYKPEPVNWQNGANNLSDAINIIKP